MLKEPAVSRNKFVVKGWLKLSSLVVKIKAVIRKTILKIDLNKL